MTQHYGIVINRTLGRTEMTASGTKEHCQGAVDAFLTSRTNPSDFQVVIVADQPAAVDADTARAAFDAATEAAYQSSRESVRAAVQFAAHRVREAYPDARVIEFVDSDQGDYLTPYAIDGDEDIPDDLAEDLDSVGSCIYDAHRSAHPALVSGNDRPLHKTDEVNIDIQAALHA